MVKRKRTIDRTKKSTNFRPASIEFVDNRTEAVPFCQHGPTILLDRVKNGRLERFYACAVCRSKKGCNFYRSYEQERSRPMSQEKIRLVKTIMKRNRRRAGHKKLYWSLKSYRKLRESERRYCVECCELISSLDVAKSHSDRGHEIVKGLTEKRLREPSKLLKILDDEKKESQFMFSRETLQMIEENILAEKLFEFDGVLCIGAPRLMEYLRRNAQSRRRFKSFLLDYDYRYSQFYSPRNYAQFNMFNGYFYTPLGQKSFDRFLGSIKNLLIVIDPPYGGLIAPIGRMLDDVKNRFESTNDGGKLDVVFVSPYFMQAKIEQAINGARMLDYKVTYDSNNSSISNPSESYVRIFTTLDPSRVELPAHLGYRLCDQCNRYVSAENQHCDKCKECTSKDGRPYVHCEQCAKCVKDRYRHCAKCDRCHKPSDDSNNSAGGGRRDQCRSIDSSPCELCGAIGHVWIGCSRRNIDGGEEIDGEGDRENRRDQSIIGRSIGRKNLDRSMGKSVGKIQKRNRSAVKIDDQHSGSKRKIASIQSADRSIKKSIDGKKRKATAGNSNLKKSK